VQLQTDLVCLTLPDDFTFTYQNSGELGLTVQKFNINTASNSMWLNALDAGYQLETDKIIQEIPYFTGSLCAQFTGTRMNQNNTVS
jgi:hypothetical protein